MYSKCILLFSNNVNAEIQKKVFRKQLHIALEKKLPIVIHSRDSHEECLSILKEVYSLINLFIYIDYIHLTMQIIIFSDYSKGTSYSSALFYWILQGSPRMA